MAPAAPTTPTHSAAPKPRAVGAEGAAGTHGIPPEPTCRSLQAPLLAPKRPVTLAGPHGSPVRTRPQYGTAWPDNVAPRLVLRGLVLLALAGALLLKNLLQDAPGQAR